MRKLPIILIARRVPLIFAVLAAALVLSASSVAATAGWTSPTVVFDGNYMNPSIVTDAHGHVHMAVRGDTGIWYLTNKTGQWTRTRLTKDVVVDPNEDPPLVIAGRDPQIALDPWDGSLTVLYLRGDNSCCPDSGQDLRYVTNRSGSWSAPRSIPSTHNAERRTPSLVVRHGVIAVTTTTGWYDSTTVEFLTNASGHWTSALLGPERTPGPMDPSLAIDSHGRPHIAYVVFALARPTVIRLATGATKTGSFSVTKVMTADGARMPSLALDAHDQPRLAWARDDGTWYASRNASGWHATRVAPGTMTALLRFDRNGRLHLLSTDWDHGAWYASMVNGVWHTAKLDDREINSSAMSVAPGGKTAVVYTCGRYDHSRVWFTQTR